MQKYMDLTRFVKNIMFAMCPTHGISFDFTNVYGIIFFPFFLAIFKKFEKKQATGCKNATGCQPVSTITQIVYLYKLKLHRFQMTVQCSGC